MASLRISCWCRQDDETNQLTSNRQVTLSALTLIFSGLLFCVYWKNNSRCARYREKLFRLEKKEFICLSLHLLSFFLLNFDKLKNLRICWSWSLSLRTLLAIYLKHLYNLLFSQRVYVCGKKKRILGPLKHLKEQKARRVSSLIPSSHWQEAQPGPMCGPVTSLPPSVRKVRLLWGVGAARGAAWASVTAWRHTVVVFPAVKFNPDFQENGTAPQTPALTPVPVRPLCFFFFPFLCTVVSSFLGTTSMCLHILCVGVSLCTVAIFIYISKWLSKTYVVYCDLLLHGFVSANVFVMLPQL